ncbi:MAG: hypothetical protein KAT28_00430 [Candidatus Aenigmarchaeota archaeon]|nr:hypothetical protein [Candidatus Aenigmarchaeota archaeon]
MVNKRKILDRFSADYGGQDISVIGRISEIKRKYYMVAGPTNAKILNYPYFDEDYKKLLTKIYKKRTNVIINGKEIVLTNPETGFSEFGIELDSLSFNYPLWKYETR